jgi:hypothetical protein
MQKYEQALIFAQRLKENRLTYSIKEDAVPVSSSRATAYRRLEVLSALGIITKTNHIGRFIINNPVLISQSCLLIERLIPSLQALKCGRKFGRYYINSDIKFAEDMMNNNNKIMTTLDYRAWELTKYQYPSDLYIYVNDIDKAVKDLKNNGFSEGKKGHIVLLPSIGEFRNEVERVYLDSLAKGGRSIKDAIAIELLYGDKLGLKGRFSADDIEGVRDNLRAFNQISK